MACDLWVSELGKAQLGSCSAGLSWAHLWHLGVDGLTHICDSLLVVSFIIQQAFLGLFLWWGPQDPKNISKDLPDCTSVLQASLCSTFANIALAKARHMAEPRVKVTDNGCNFDTILQTSYHVHKTRPAIECNLSNSQQ